jgi:predicted metal-dependent hydrolase
MTEKLLIGGFDVEVTKKDIKNIHLTVHPPTGLVKVSAPLNTNTDIIKAFALTKLDWIKKNHKKLSNQVREPKRELVDRESIYIWGRRLLLVIEPYRRENRVVLSGKHLYLYVKEAAGHDARQALLERWYRDELRRKADPIISHWQNKFNANVRKLEIRRMKTKWGSCTPASGTIRLNTELIHKHPEALEFVAVHELAHFQETGHSERFFKLIDEALPRWRSIRQKLNEAPLSFTTWSRKS